MSLQLKGTTMPSFLEQVKQMAKQFVAATEALHLLQEAETGYLGYYQDCVKRGMTQSNDISYTPEEVQMQFWRNCCIFAMIHLLFLIILIHTLLRV